MAGNKSYKVTPEIIVSKNMLFRIPLYQRLFTWGEAEVEQLMEDLHTHFSKPIKKPYYLGMLTVVDQTVVDQEKRFDLIDGQQRTTVLMLLSIALIRSLRERDCEQYSSNWEKFCASSNRVFFNGRSEDRDFIHSLYMNKESLYRNKNMDDGLSYMVKYLSKKFPERESLIAFADAIYNRLTLFVTELPAHYVKNPTSLNEYFEAMNSSGKSLEQHEILKVELLRDYQNDDKLRLTRLWNAVANFEKPIIELNEKDGGRQEQRNSYIRHIRENNIGNFLDEYDRRFDQQSDNGARISIAEIEVRKHDFNIETYRDKENAIISFPQFLLMVLALHTGNEDLAKTHPSKLHETFKNNSIPQNEISAFYNDLFLYRLLLDMYVVRLNYSSSSSSRTLICNDEEEEDHAGERLKQFQAMLDVSTEPHIWVLPLLKHLKSLDQAPTQMELLRFLMVKDMQRSGHNECPQDSNLDYDSKPRYWLWRLDYALWEKLTIDKDAYKSYENIDNDAIRKYQFRANRSIEHLHPQNQDNNDEWEEDDVNSFGNLAMISAGFNSQQSNLPVHVKFANLEVQIGNKNLQSLKLYFMYLKAKGSEAEWSTTAKDKHAEEMLQILNESIERVKSYGQQ